MNRSKTIAIHQKQTNVMFWIKVALWIGLATAFLYLGRLTPATEAAVVGESTIPSVPARLTVLVGPIDTLDIDQKLWTVAGIPIQLTPSTRFNERLERAEAGAWARVEGYPAEDDGLVATRIKILPPHPFITIQGPLDELSEDAAIVGGIALEVTGETRLLGNPVPGIRVRVIADPDYEPVLIAQRIQRAGDPYDDDDDDDQAEEPGSDKIELIGVVQHRPDDGVLGPWQISTVSVTVNPQTEVKEQVSSLIDGAWVKVEGHVEGGIIIASELKSTETRRHHKLEGTLDSLTNEEIVVNGITLTLATDVKIEDDPQPGERVEIQAYLNDNILIVTHVEGKHNGDDDDDNDENGTRHVTGEVHSLPAEGMLGEWLVGKHTIVVDEATQIYEHKGLVKKGAMVRVEVLKGTQEPLTAVEVVVLKGNDDDDDDDDDGNQFVEFKGTIQKLPDGTLIGDWLVSERTISVGERTEIKGDVNKIAIGARVEVKGYRLADNTIEARRIKIENGDDDDDDDHEHPGGERFDLTGTVEGLPKNGLIGAWTVAGHEVKVTSKTEIDDDDNIAIGVEVEVEGRKSGNGPIHAEKIKVHEEDDED